ncbi:MAG: hypothetical protein CMM46_13975 [Rhodospirillaceae bacterium]|nr:hypothetical protein [Rhodospirillaceae bacterium]|tara:strand:+ start:268 stop:456 length:189 start_codon:yes stop_codon:yes gene_type:complete
MDVIHADLERATLLQVMAEQLLEADPYCPETLKQADSMHNLAASFLLRSRTECLGNDLMVGT